MDSFIVFPIVVLGMSPNHVVETDREDTTTPLYDSDKIVVISLTESKTSEGHICHSLYFTHPSTLPQKETRVKRDSKCDRPFLTLNIIEHIIYPTFINRIR